MTVAIVPHTHWDREWYLPFQVFRIRLVTLLDRLLPLLESDLSYARFLLDGQTAVLDDYLAVRPEAAARLERLATSGRLQVGPWMILMDEFMVSGETLVRDLQLGMTRATALGGAMQVGYLPDMFGHVAQMPQLLALAGLAHAVVWRGVPSAVTQTAFWWEAPDGSRVRAEYLYGSYSNGRDLPDDAKALVTRAHGYEIELGEARLPGGGMLLMNGTDHQLPQPWLGRVVARRTRSRTTTGSSSRRSPSTWPSSRRRASRPGRASCARGPAPTCSWASPRTASTCTSCARPPSGRSSGAPSRCRRCCAHPTSTRRRCSAWRGARSCSTARTTRRAPAATTRSSRPSASATRRRARSATRSCARRCTRWPAGRRRPVRRWS